MKHYIDMLDDEWLDEFERNWGITDRSSSTDKEHQHKNNRRTTDLGQKEEIPCSDPGLNRGAN
jgi:hypothetical protein